MSFSKLLCSLFLVLGVAISSYSAQSNRVMIRVFDGQHKPLKGVRLRMKPNGPISEQSDRNGLTWINVPAETQPGQVVPIEIVNGPGQDWVLTTAEGDVISVRSFGNGERSIAPITVISRHNPQILLNGQVLYSSASRIIRSQSPLRIAELLTPDQRRAVLTREARRLGVKPADLAKALQAWSERVNDPEQKG